MLNKIKTEWYVLLRFCFLVGGESSGKWRYVVVDFGEEKIWINFFKRY